MIDRSDNYKSAQARENQNVHLVNSGENLNLSDESINALANILKGKLKISRDQITEQENLSSDDDIELNVPKIYNLN